MAKFTTNITMQTDKETFTASKEGALQEVHRVSQDIEASSDTGVYVLINVGSGSASVGGFKSAKGLMIKNSGRVGAEIIIVTDSWSDGGGSATTSPTTSTALDTSGGNEVISFLLGSGDVLYLPNLRMTNNGSLNSMANARLLDNQAPDSNMYVDISTVGSGFDNTTDPVTFTSADGDFWKVGDLIRCNAEIVEVTAISGNDLTVKRALFGTDVASHGDGETLRLQFSNTYADYDKYTTCQTDGSGRFGATNFFGYARTADAVADGLVPGSISGKFYSAGYQELGMSGITSSTESGLDASTAYAIDIAVDGGSDTTLSFTTSSNTKFGGSDGILQKIQDAMDVQFYTTSSNMLDKRVTVGIVNGDVRFTSGQRLSTSAISITAPASGTTPFGVGRFSMAVGAIEQAVTALLPPDLVYDNLTNISSSNISQMFYDDGLGNIGGVCTGTINYETGAIDITGCPPNANFVVTASYGSGHSGGEETSVTAGNSLVTVGARSVNHKIPTTIDVIGVR